MQQIKANLHANITETHSHTEYKKKKINENKNERRELN